MPSKPASAQPVETGRASIQINPDLLAILKKVAVKNGRSTNGEIAYRLAQSITPEDKAKAKKG